MRKIAAVCLCAGLGILSFTLPLSDHRHKHHQPRVKEEVPSAFHFALVEIPPQAFVSLPAPPAPVCALGGTASLRAEAAGVPCAWVPTAVCEEQGKNDPAYGYFGIQQWHGFAGYTAAGSAPLSVQLAWEASVGQNSPPDAPGQCHAY
jgi:hypothetical protein